MICLNPSRVVNPRYSSRAAGRLALFMATQDDVFPDDYWLSVPCGRCFSCLKSRSSSWTLRLIHEVQFGSCRSPIFCTFTFASDVDPFDNTIVARCIRQFCDVLRKKLKHAPRHWFVTELGEANGRLHLHGLIFESLGYDVIRHAWKHGFSYFKQTTYARIAYCTKYSLKGNSLFYPKVYASPGLGAGYTSNPVVQLTHLAKLPENDRYFCVLNGRLWSLPRYYRDKIFSEARQKARIEALELHPPSFSVRIGRMQFTDALSARLYRSQFYRETLKSSSFLNHPSKSISYGTFPVTKGDTPETFKP